MRAVLRQEDPADRGRVTALGVLAERNRRFFIGQSASLLGDGMVGVALAFAVLDLTGSPADLGYVLAARSIPLVAVLLVGGVIADRFPRRRIMVTADVARFLGQATMATLLISGHARIWELAALQALHGAAAGTFNPASTGLIPSIVTGSRLQQANALRGLAISIGNIAGPATAGVLVAAASPGWAIAADAARHPLRYRTHRFQHTVRDRPATPCPRQSPVPGQRLRLVRLTRLPAHRPGHRGPARRGTRHLPRPLVGRIRPAPPRPCRPHCPRHPPAVSRRPGLTLAGRSG